MNEKYKFKLGRDYESRNQSAIDDLTNQYTNRQFSYDADTDAAYQDYAKMMRESGYKAMQDTVAHASAMTGGYGNSYAATAGQQVYNDYAKQIGAAQADFYDRALANFNSEGNDLLSKIGVLENRENADRALWEEDYTRAWNEAEQRANYGDVSELAGLLDIDTDTLEKTLGYGAVPAEYKEGLKNAIKNDKGTEYINNLVGQGYDVSTLIKEIENLGNSGELGGTVTFKEDGTDDEGRTKYKIVFSANNTGTVDTDIYTDGIVSNDAVNASVEGIFNMKEGELFHIAREKNKRVEGDPLANPSSYGDKDSAGNNWTVRASEKITSDYPEYEALQNSERKGILLYNGNLYYKGGGAIYLLEGAGGGEEYDALLEYMQKVSSRQ